MTHALLQVSVGEVKQLQLLALQSTSLGATQKLQQQHPLRTLWLASLSAAQQLPQYRQRKQAHQQQPDVEKQAR